MTHAGGHEAMTDKKKEATSIPLEGKTAAELHALLSSGHFYCINGRRFFALYRYSPGRFYGSLTLAGESSEDFSLSEDELLKELQLWRYTKDER